MAEVKQVQSQRKAAPTVDRWLLDVESDDAVEPEIDPYGGRFFGDQIDYDSEDADFDRAGGQGLFSF